jgi:carboxypeptidase Q
MGDHDNVLVLGAHTDSIRFGPGINDDGSGVAALLEVALYLPNYNHTNAVRFGFWTAEEEGLLGSKHYVEHLSSNELMKVRAYLNFDMIGSGNGVIGV